MLGLKKKKLEKQLSMMSRKLVAISQSSSIISEQFRTIRTNISFSSPHQDIKTILVTSSISSEGKSTNAANIGVVFAQEGKRVLLVDADMRKPALHIIFKVANTRGLSTVLARKEIFSDVICDTSVEGLFVIPSGPLPPNPAELLSSKTMEAFMEDVKKDFDIIIFDAPPVLTLSDAQILSNKCEGTLLIVNSGVVDEADVLKAKASLNSSKAKILGVVLNNFKMSNHHYKQYSSKKK